MDAKKARLAGENLLTLGNWMALEIKRRRAENKPNSMPVVGCVNPDLVFIDPRAQIGDGVFFFPFSQARGKSVIGRGVTVDSYSVIEDSVIGDNAEIGVRNTIRRAKIGAMTKIPYDAELTDVEIGENTNIGRGVTISNFNGLQKRKTVIGDGCFIGTNVNINGGTVIGNEVRIFPNLFIADHSPIPAHAWLKKCVCLSKKHLFDIEQYCSFKIPNHWLWITTGCPVHPEPMKEFLKLLADKSNNNKEEIIKWWEHAKGKKVEKLIEKMVLP